MNRHQRHSLRLAFASMIFFPPDTGGGDGGGNAAPKKTLEEQLSQARTDLAAAQSSVTSLTKERDDAKTEATTAKADAQKLQTQFDELSKDATKLKADLKDSQDGHAAKDTKITGLEAKATKDATEIGRLESLCGIKGVSTTQAPPTLSEQPAKLTVADFDAKLQAATTPKAKAAVAEEMEKAYAEGRLV